MELTSTIIDLLKVLCKAIEEVRIAVYYTPHRNESQDVPDTPQEKQPEMPMSISLMRVQVSGEVLDLGTPKFNDVAKSIGQITIDFSLMQMAEVYVMQNSTVAEMKVREGALIKQTKVMNKSVNKMKQVV